MRRIVFTTFVVATLARCATVDHVLDPIATAAKDLSDGLKGIDPVALNRLVEQNATLRTQLIDIQGQLSSLSVGYGIVTLKDRRVALRVPAHTGTFTVTAWVDTRANWSWQDRTFADMELVYPIDVERFWHGYAAAKFGDYPLVIEGQKAHWAENVWGVINDFARSEARRAANQMLINAPLVPLPSSDLIDIGESKMTNGSHTIVFEVTPIAPDVSGKWSFRGQLVVIGADGKEYVIKEFDLQSTTFPAQPLGKPLPQVAALVQVAASQP